MVYYRGLILFLSLFWAGTSYSSPSLIKHDGIHISFFGGMQLALDADIKYGSGAKGADSILENPSSISVSGVHAVTGDSLFLFTDDLKLTNNYTSWKYNYGASFGAGIGMHFSNFGFELEAVRSVAKPNTSYNKLAFVPSNLIIYDDALADLTVVNSFNEYDAVLYDITEDIYARNSLPTWSTYASEIHPYVQTNIDPVTNVNSGGSGSTNAAILAQIRSDIGSSDSDLIQIPSDYVGFYNSLTDPVNVGTVGDNFDIAGASTTQVDIDDLSLDSQDALYVISNYVYDFVSDPTAYSGRAAEINKNFLLSNAEGVVLTGYIASAFYDFDFSDDVRLRFSAGAGYGETSLLNRKINGVISQYKLVAEIDLVEGFSITIDARRIQPMFSLYSNVKISPLKIPTVPLEGDVRYTDTSLGAPVDSNANSVVISGVKLKEFEHSMISDSLNFGISYKF